MGTTRRTQLLMDPDEYRRLRDLARRQRTSVGALIRTAVRATFLEAPKANRKSIVEAILKMNLPTTRWERARKEIEAGHADLP